MRWIVFTAQLIFVITYVRIFCLKGCTRPMLQSKYNLDTVTDKEGIEETLNLIRNSKPFPESKLPGSVVRQREIVAELEEEFRMSAVSQVRSITWNKA